VETADTNYTRINPLIWLLTWISIQADSCFATEITALVVEFPRVVTGDVVKGD
jgi:hypothetical protein